MASAPHLPSRDLYITPSAISKFAIGKIGTRPSFLAEHFLSVRQIWENVLRTTRPAAAVCGGAAGRSRRGQRSAAHGNRSGGLVNRQESACPLCSSMARNFLRRRSGSIMRPPCAALSAKLTLMSFKADAHVMG